MSANCRLVLTVQTWVVSTFSVFLQMWNYSFNYSLFPLKLFVFSSTGQSGVGDRSSAVTFDPRQHQRYGWWENRTRRTSAHWSPSRAFPECTALLTQVSLISEDMIEVVLVIIMSAVNETTSNSQEQDGPPPHIMSPPWLEVKSSDCFLHVQYSLFPVGVLLKSPLISCHLSVHPVSISTGRRS